MKRILVLCLAVVLWSCDAPRSYGPQTPYYHFPQGSRLVLIQAIEIPAGRATARIQNGRVVPYGHVQEAYPHCIFEISTVRETPQRVEADVFAIVRVQRDVSTLAAGPAFIRAAFADDDIGPTQMFYKTIFWLRSERQPGVRWLTCQSDQFAAGISMPNHLTVPEIRQALGGIFTLELPDTRL